MNRYERWPFEENIWAVDEFWWESCYQDWAQMEALRGSAMWLLVHGGPRSGKSVALESLRRGMENELICNYPPDFWPTDEHTNHLAQMLGMASRAIMERIQKAPSLLDRTSKTQKEFLHWLIKTFNQPRMMDIFIDSLPIEYDSQLRGIAAKELYTSQDNQQEVEYQVGELVSLCRRIGLRGVTYLVDVPDHLSPQQQGQLRALYQWLSLAQKDGFRVIAAASEQLVTSNDLVRKTRGRVKTHLLQISSQEVYEAADLHIQAATDGEVCTIASLAVPDLLARLEKFICDEFGQLAVGAWIKLGQELLNINDPADEPIENTDENYSRICSGFFRNNCKLHLFADDNMKGVWRGHKFIPLEDAQFELAEKLWHAKTMGYRPVDHNTMQLSKENMHTRVRRLRDAIEPIPGEEIYIISKRNEGYWFF